MAKPSRLQVAMRRGTRKPMVRTTVSGDPSRADLVALCDEIAASDFVLAEFGSSVRVEVGTMDGAVVFIVSPEEDE